MAVLFFITASLYSGQTAERHLLNVSFDVSREFYQGYNDWFVKEWQAKHQEKIVVDASHGGSSKQARAVIDGLEADVVTLNQETDITILQEKGLVKTDWRKAFPHHSSPFTSTIVFLVRKGNPKKIKDWSDLVRSDVKVIIPNPKTSGNGRYSYLAAWAYAKKQKDDEKAPRDFIEKLFRNVPVLDTGGRAATTTFVQRGLGDVLLTFENEVLLITKQFNPNDFEVVYPSLSILAELPVAVVDKVAAKHKTQDLAQAYLQSLFSPASQQLAAKHYYRPQREEVKAQYRELFPEIPLVTIDEAFGGWAKAQAQHFKDGGEFDQIYSRIEKKLAQNQ